MGGLGDAALIGREMVFAQAIDRDSLGRVGQAYASSSSTLPGVEVLR